MSDTKYPSNLPWASKPAYYGLVLDPSYHDEFRELAQFSKEVAPLSCSIRCMYQGCTRNSNIPLIRAIDHIKSFLI